MVLQIDDFSQTYEDYGEDNLPKIEESDDGITEYAEGEFGS